MRFLIKTRLTRLMVLLLWLAFSDRITRAAIVPIETIDTIQEQKDQRAKNESDVTKENVSDEDSKLELVHVLFRHGPRTPVSTYPKDPYLNETYKPFGWGQLTNEAKVELYKIGKQLRKRYKDFLSSYYKPDVLHAQATESTRTMMSLQMVLAGLFPPENTPMEWNRMLNWQPIPVFAEPEQTDVRLRMKVPCPRYDEALLEVLQLPEVKQLHAQNAELLQQLADLTGLNVTYSHDVTNVFITLLAQQHYGLELPEWTKEYFPDRMLPLAAQSYLYDAYTPELRKLKGGFYLDHMYEQMQAKVSGKLEPAARRFYLYCAHDWTVTNILSALGVWQPQMPRFSALIAFELHRRVRSGEYFVEIYFQNDPNEEPEQLEIPGCRKQCPLEKLIELSERVLPDGSYEQLCMAKNVGSTSNEKVSYHT